MTFSKSHIFHTTSTCLTVKCWEPFHYSQQYLPAITQLIGSLRDVVVILKVWTLNMLPISSWNHSQVNATEHLWWQVNIGSGDGLVPSGSKPLSEPMLTRFYDTHQMTSLSHNELSHEEQITIESNFIQDHFCSFSGRPVKNDTWSLACNKQPYFLKGHYKWITRLPDSNIRVPTWLP